MHSIRPVEEQSALGLADNGYILWRIYIHLEVSVNAQFDLPRIH